MQNSIFLLTFNKITKCKDQKHNCLTKINFIDQKLWTKDKLQKDSIHNHDNK